MTRNTRQEPRGITRLKRCHHQAVALRQPRTPRLPPQNRELHGAERGARAPWNGRRARATRRARTAGRQRGRRATPAQAASKDGSADATPPTSQPAPTPNRASRPSLCTPRAVHEQLLNVEARVELRAEAGGVPGRGARQLALLEDGDVGPAELRQVEGEAAAGDGAADDRDSGASLKPSRRRRAGGRAGGRRVRAAAARRTAASA